MILITMWGTSACQNALNLELLCFRETLSIVQFNLYVKSGSKKHPMTSTPQALKDLTPCFHGDGQQCKQHSSMKTKQQLANAA